MNDLRLLAQFAAVYRTRSFRAAAEQLGAAQSSVTKAIQRLEREVGLTLFNRTTRSVEPTDTARQLIAPAEQALKAVGAFSEEARLLAVGELGAIRVGAIALAAETLVAAGLARLAVSHPELDVDVVVGGSDVYRDLATGACDVAVADETNFASSPYAPALRMEPLRTEHLVFAHRRGHPAAHTETVAELLEHALAVPSRYFNENRLFQHLTVRPRYRLNSLSACLSLAAASDVVTLAPESLIARAGQQSLQAARFDTGVNVRLVMVSLARNAQTPAVRAFGNALAAT